MFDPYEKWLGISKDQRPIDFFLLLDIDPDEDDPAVIKKAAKKQAARVSQHEDGPHAQACARLLDEIEKARATLSNPAKRKAYEALLKKNARKDEPEDEEEENDSPRRAKESKKKGLGKSSGKAKTPEKDSRVKLWVAIGGAAALLIGVGLAIYFSTGKKNADNTSSAPADPNGTPPEVAAGPDSGTPKFQPKTDPKPPKNEPPKNEPPKNEPPKNEPPKNEPPKNEPPKNEPPKNEPPPPKPPVVAGLPRPAERKPPAKVVKLPAPDQTAQDNAEKAIKEEYKAAYGKGKNDDLLLAAKLLQPGRENRADPAAWFVLLSEARDAAVRSGRPRLAVEAIDEIDRWFAIDAFDLKLQALAKITESADDTAARALIKVALSQFEEAITADNAVVAQKFLDAADAAARKRKPDNNHALLMKKRQQELESFQTATKAVAASRTTLNNSPADPNANQVVGKHLCLFEGRWDEGLPLLAKGGTELASTAKQDLTPPADVAAQVAMGDAWWKMSEDLDGRERRWLMERAAAWYELAHPKVTGADEARLTERLTKLDAEDSVRNKRLIPGSFYGRDAEDRILLLREGGGTRRSEEAVERGLEWLAKHQAANGRWATDAFHLVSKCACTERGEKHDIAGTAFGLLPFLGAGETHKRGRYAQAVQRGLAYLLSQQKPDGKFHDNAYENALATLAVCEAYGMTADGSLKAQAQAAATFIVKAQDPESGSWGYSAGTKGDTSVSGWQFSALKAGHYAGLSIPAEAFSKFSGFLDTVADPGGLGYGYNTPGAGRATSATGLLCREYLGWGPRQPTMNKGIKQLLLPQNFVAKDKPSFYFLFYATQAMHNAGSEAWDIWNPKARELLIDLQDQGKDIPHQKGSWSPIGDDYAKQGGRLMTTSLSLLILEAYYNYIPFNSHGPTVRRD